MTIIAEKTTITRDVLRSARVHRQIRILPHHNLIYIVNQKAACSTIKLMLYRAHKGDNSLSPQRINAPGLVPGANDVGWPKTIEMLRSAFVFTFVRHPATRLLSAYTNKIIQQRRKYGPRINALLRRDLDADISLDDFMDSFEEQEPTELNPHWRPQYLNTMTNVLRFDLIGRIETFDQDIAKVSALRGIPIEAVNPSRRKPPTPTAAQIRRIERFYSDDYEIFGYS